MNGTSESLGQRLRRERQSRGWTLREVQELTGIHNAHLSQLETEAIKHPSKELLRILAATYAIDIGELETLTGMSLGETEYVCGDCGVMVVNRQVHNRFHSILNSHAWALAVLQTAHVSERTHAKWDVREQVEIRQFDNWSRDALNEMGGQQDE